ncbi:MAG: ribosome maturation factor RimP [Candidatus Omnitrophica bacterium]|nr:ribosome maturation factor RimP [Candidatus Omnitrophota bacterium]
MDDQRFTQIRSLAEPILAEREMELVELTVRPQGRQQLIRLLVDKIGGVTIQQCAKVNGLIGVALEAANLIEGSYTIEVSSPGLDRPLASRRDFERALGDEVVVQTAFADGRVRESRGTVLAVQQDAVVLQMAAGNVTIPFGDIRGAKKAIRWS